MILPPKVIHPTGEPEFTPILDTDVTVKTLYGHQEGAKVGYNLIHQYHCKSGWEKTHDGFVSRPLLLHGVGKQTQHAGQTPLTIRILKHYYVPICRRATAVGRVTR
jgi:hypothetical protein